MLEFIPTSDSGAPGESAMIKMLREIRREVS
jgi:hypothetical protein